MYKPRPYQQEAIDSILNWIKKSTEPCLMEGSTGCGKSIIIAQLAKWIEENTGKKVLCLAPKAELTEQNHEKYTSYDMPASIYAASIEKSLRHNVVFGMPQTVKNSIRRFSEGDFAAVIIDECHAITPTIKAIIEEMKAGNPNLRVIGLSATPYRMSSGYIYAYDENGDPVPSDQTNDPYFHSMVYRITAPFLIEQGFLTRPHADPNHLASYDTSAIKRHSQSEYEKAFEGKGRKTAAIIADVVGHARERMAVMIFAATIRHAKECMESLPPEMARMVTGETPKAERKQIVADFKAMRFKYLVNVAVYTTGFDVPHVDLIAILRPTESASLLQQIIGRGMRLHPDKQDCLILDYAENIERHQLESDLFTPQIKARSTKKGEPVAVKCPLCSSTNEFTKRKTDDGDDLLMDDEGYQLDLAGNRIEIEGQFLPGHYGRRCFGFQMMPNGKADRCEHRWAVKLCPTCQHENDITARDCENCNEELIDPNTKLNEQFHRMKADPLQVSTDEVREFTMSKWKSKAGNMTIKASYKTDYASFDVWYNPESRAGRIRNLYEDFSRAYYNGKIAPDLDTFMQYKEKGMPPKTITYQKQKGKQYWNVYAHNKPIDKEPEL